jgi:hypothetical protein
MPRGHFISSQLLLFESSFGCLRLTRREDEADHLIGRRFGEAQRLGVHLRPAEIDGGEVRRVAQHLIGDREGEMAAAVGFARFREVLPVLLDEGFVKSELAEMESKLKGRVNDSYLRSATNPACSKW